MTVTAVERLDDARCDDLVAALYAEGIVGLPGAFDPVWVDRLGKDALAAFEQARARDGGAVSRGPQRWCVEVYPEHVRGFADPASHPWIVQVATAVLRADYEIVEIGFDMPFADAVISPGTGIFRCPRSPATPGYSPHSRSI